MANHYYINNQKNLMRQAESITPAVYASIAIALHESDFSDEDIQYLFARSQQIWGEHYGDINSMLIKCFNETGIQLMSDKQYAKAVKAGLIKE